MLVFYCLFFTFSKIYIGPYKERRFVELIQMTSLPMSPKYTGSDVICLRGLEFHWKQAFSWPQMFTDKRNFKSLFWSCSQKGKELCFPSCCCCCCCCVALVVSDSVRPHRRQPTRENPRLWDSPGKNTGVGCHFLLQYMKMKSESEVAQSCPTLCDPMDCSLPGSSVHGIFQARVLEWGAIAFSAPYPRQPLIYQYTPCLSRFACLKDFIYRWNWAICALLFSKFIHAVAYINILFLFIIK